MLKLPNNFHRWFTLDWRQVDWRRTVLLVLLVLAVAAAVWQYFCPQVRTITQWQFHPVPVIREVKSVQQVRVACPEQGLVALDKKEVAERLELPWLQPEDVVSAGPNSAPVAGNPADLQVTATAQLPESANGYQVVTVVNTETGVTTPVVKEAPAPWFQFRNDAAMGIRYGLCAGTNSPYCGDVYGRWDFLRMKNIYVSASGDLTTEAEAKIQLGVEYRW